MDFSRLYNECSDVFVIVLSFIPFDELFEVYMRELNSFFRQLTIKQVRVSAKYTKYEIMKDDISELLNKFMIRKLEIVQEFDHRKFYYVHYEKTFSQRIDEINPRINRIIDTQKKNIREINIDYFDHIYKEKWKEGTKKRCLDIEKSLYQLQNLEKLRFPLFPEKIEQFKKLKSINFNYQDSQLGNRIEIATKYFLTSPRIESLTFDIFRLNSSLGHRDKDMDNSDEGKELEFDRFLESITYLKSLKKIKMYIPNCFSYTPKFINFLSQNLEDIRIKYQLYHQLDFFNDLAESLQESKTIRNVSIFLREEVIESLDSFLKIPNIKLTVHSNLNGKEVRSLKQEIDFEEVEVSKFVYKNRKLMNADIVTFSPLFEESETIKSIEFCRIYEKPYKVLEQLFKKIKTCDHLEEIIVGVCCDIFKDKKTFLVVQNLLQNRGDSLISIVLKKVRVRKLLNKYGCYVKFRPKLVKTGEGIMDDETFEEFFEFLQEECSFLKRLDIFSDQNQEYQSRIDDWLFLKNKDVQKKKIGKKRKTGKTKKRKKKRKKR